MTRYARIDADDNTCAEFIDFAPEGRFHPSIRWLAVPEALEPYADHQYTAVGDSIEPPSLDYLREQLQQRLAAERFDAETGGVELPDGTRVLTDRQSQAQLTSAYQSLSQPLIDSIEWKAPSGWITATEADLRPIAELATHHVQACFKAERHISEQIDAAGTLDALLVIDVKTAFTDELASIKAAAAAPA